MLSDIGIVILAAGDGKRMKSDVPKVMNLLHGKPLIGHVMDMVVSLGLTRKPTIVVSPNHTLVQDYLGDKADYVTQKKQLGTGHAVSATIDFLRGKASQVVVLYGDVPFVKAKSIKLLVEEQIRAENIITLMTVVVPNFDGQWKFFSDLSRIKRDVNGDIVEDIQMRDASEEDLKIKEVNPAFFCFQADWLWNSLPKLQNTNAQKEYYLTDLIKLAIQSGRKIGSIKIDPQEAMGINTKEHLELAEELRRLKD